MIPTYGWMDGWMDGWMAGASILYIRIPSLKAQLSRRKEEGQKDVTTIIKLL